MSTAAVATVLVFTYAIGAMAEVASESCDFQESASISFTSPNAKDRIEVHAFGKPCGAGSLDLAVFDPKGREIYRFRAPLTQLLLAHNQSAHWTELLVKEMAHASIVPWTKIPDIDNLTVDDVAGNVEFAVAPSVYRRFREQRLPVLQHATYHEGWQAVVFDGKQSVVIVRAGL